MIVVGWCVGVQDKMLRQGSARVMLAGGMEVKKELAMRVFAGGGCGLLEKHLSHYSESRTIKPW